MGSGRRTRSDNIVLGDGIVRSVDLYTICGCTTSIVRLVYHKLLSSYRTFVFASCFLLFAKPARRGEEHDEEHDDTGRRLLFFCRAERTKGPVRRPSNVFSTCSPRLWLSQELERAVGRDAGALELLADRADLLGGLCAQLGVREHGGGLAAGVEARGLQVRVGCIAIHPFENFGHFGHSDIRTFGHFG